MKGSNNLYLNEATIIEAMQEYLDRRMMPGRAPEVASVEWSDADRAFIVKTTEYEASDSA